MNQNEQSAVEWAKRMMDTDFIIVDTETNGWGDNFDSDVIQIGIINRNADVLLNALIYASEIQQQATGIHGLTFKNVANAPSFKSIWPAISEILLHAETIIAYNAAFDHNKLVDQVNREKLGPLALDRQWECAMLAYAQFHGDWNNYRGDWKWKKLDVAVARFGIEIPRELHDATLDVRLTLEVIKAMAALEIDNG